MASAIVASSETAGKNSSR